MDEKQTNEQDDAPMKAFDFENLTMKRYKDNFLRHEYWKKEKIRERTAVLKKSTEYKNASVEIIYFVLALISTGINKIEDVREHLKHAFIAFSESKLIEPIDVGNAITYAQKEDLIRKKNSSFKVTDKGCKFVESFYFDMVNGNFWLKKIATENFVMIITAACLILLTLLKIATGLSLDSQAMFTEGMENLTDLVKIAIIFIGIKFGKDRIASIVIIGMMIITGFSLLTSGIFSLIDPQPINPTIQAFIISVISMAINGVLMMYKGYVGRLSGNISLLSDSKDSLLNVQISAGVLVGLVFAIFDLYVVDSVIAIFIAVLCIKEGGEVMYELITTDEDDFDISKMKVPIDNIYGNRLTAWILSVVRTNPRSDDEIKVLFHEKIELSSRYYGGFANYFYDQLEQEAFPYFLNQLKKSKLIWERDDGMLYITDSGRKHLRKETEDERKKKLNPVEKRAAPHLRRVLWIAFGWIIFIAIMVLLIFYTEEINMWIAKT